MSSDARTRRTRLRPVPEHRPGDLGADELAARLAPRGVGGVLDRSLAILREDLGLLFGAGLALWLPLRIVLAYELRPAVTDELTRMALESSAMVLASVVLGALAARVVAARTARGGVDPLRVLALSPLELVGLLVIVVVSSLAGLVGLLMCFVGTVAAWWLLALAPVVYVLEREHGPVRRIGYALKRSVSLVAGSFWRWLAIATVVKLLDLVLTLPVGFLDEPGQRLSLATRFGLDPGLLEALGVLLGAVFLALSGAISGVAFAGFYFDQRARLEGVDLYLALGGLEDAEARP